MDAYILGNVLYTNLKLAEMLTSIGPALQISQKDVQVLNVLGRGASSVVNSALPDTSCGHGVLNVVQGELLILFCD